MTEFLETSGELARQARVSTPTVRKYADAGLLEFVMASNGTRLFRSGQAEKVRDLYARSIANRGGNRKSAA